MPRSLAVSLFGALVVATTWLRLEQPLDKPYRAIAVTALALVPALVRPRWARVAAGLAAATLAAWVAFGAPPDHPLRLARAAGSRFGNGFLDFYDVRTPFDPRVHAEMRGVILAAIFGFALALSFAVAARRPLVAATVLLVGAGWPATLRGSSGALVVGALILLGVLVVLAGLTARRVPRVTVPAVALIGLVAVAASTSAAIAKGGLVAWQHWDPYTAPQPPVGVSFVWDANYDGIHFPAKRTPVLEIKTAHRSLYWRAAVLDEFTADRWGETLPLRADALEPAGRAPLLRQDVRVLALADTRLVGASVPLRYDAGDAPLVSHVPGIATLPSGLTRGLRYTAWSYAPHPTTAQLQRSTPAYPIELVEPGTFLDVWHGVTTPPFGAPGRAKRLAELADSSPEAARYAALAHLALQVAGRARTPYGAASALTTWFRSTGGFVYTNRPPETPEPPLVGFVTRTRAGYCQHFAGAMALMLRYLGVPARVAVGFSSGVYDTKRGVWRVTDHDAHAWVEAWFRGYGWLPFDPTPASRPGRGQLSAPYAATLLPTGAHRGGRAIRGAGTVDPRQSDHHHGEEGSGVKTFAGGEGTSRRARGGSLLKLLALLAGGLVALVVVAKAVVRLARHATRDPRRVAAACRRDLADFLLDQRIDAARSATLHELGALVRRELAVDPDEFVGAATAARFGPPQGAAAAARRARHELRALRRRMRVRLRVRDRARGLLSLRSLGLVP